MPILDVNNVPASRNENASGTKGGVLLPPRLEQLGTPLPLGKGATSTVYKMVPPTQYVVKVIDCGSSATRLSEALHELRIMRRLSGCPFVVQLKDSEVVSAAGRYTVYVAEEYCTPLADALRERRFTPTECVDVAIGLAEALIACRDAGVLHLDVQPKNVFFTSARQLRLGDFGSSLFIEEIEDRCRLRGTLAFMAPEVFRDRLYSEQSDTYSVGVVLHCLLSGGAYPFTNECTPTEATYRLLAGERLPSIARLSERQNVLVEAALSRICAFNPSERPQSFEGLKDCLAELRSAICREEQDEPSRGDLLSEFHGRMPEEMAAPWGGPPAATMSLDACPNTLTGSPSEGYDLSDNRPGGWDSSDNACESGASVPPWGSIQFPLKAPSVRFDADPIAMTLAIDSFGRSVAGPSDAMSAPAVRPIEDSPARDIASRVDIDKVRFSVIAPQTMERDEYATIEMFMYEQEFRDVVDQLKNESFTQVQEKQSGFLSIRQESTVRVVLSSKFAEIEDGEQELVWLGGFLEFSFLVVVSDQSVRKSIPFTALVYINDVLASRLTFVVRCSAPERQQPEVVRKDVRSAFISYASADRDRVVSLIQGMRAARSDLEIFFDVQSLRVGEDWERAIIREVERRDVLYLCWSRAARASNYVELEWRHALETKGIDYIEPVPIEPPVICPPPEELKSKHFNDMLLYLLKGPSVKGTSAPSWSDMDG